MAFRPVASPLPKKARALGMVCRDAGAAKSILNHAGLLLPGLVNICGAVLFGFSTYGVLPGLLAVLLLLLPGVQDLQTWGLTCCSPLNT